MKRLLIVAAFAACAFVAGGAQAQDHKPPTDKCPKGYHTITVETAKNAEAKPGGVGAGVTRTEKYEVCRPVQASNLKEFSKKR